jgi:hypothetical protein
MCEFDKNQMPCGNVKKFKKWNFWEFWAVDGTWPTLNKFYYSYFHKWKIDFINAYIKFWTKLFRLTWRKLKKSKIGHRKSEEKGEFESP